MSVPLLVQVNFLSLFVRIDQLLHNIGNSCEHQFVRRRTLSYGMGNSRTEKQGNEMASLPFCLTMVLLVGGVIEQ